MNITTLHLTTQPIVRADLFSWANGITDKTMTLLQGVIVVIGIVIFVLATIYGKGRLPAIILGLVAGGLFIWGGIAGVFWVRDQAKSTVQTTSSSIVELHSHGASLLALPELPDREL